MPRLAVCIILSLFPVTAALAQYALGTAGATTLKNPLDGSQFGYGSASGDIDNNGIDDLIVSPNGAGGIRIMRGEAWTIGDANPLRFFSSTFQPGTGYRGNTLVTGDFDGDGRDEIAFGNPSYSASVPSGGRAYVARRDNNTASWNIVTTIQQELNGYPGVHEQGDAFGATLAVGDFNADGYDDLAIGAYGEAVGTTDEAGAVMITYGTASGITSAGSSLITRNSDGLTFTPVEGDRFGNTLATGDFDADGYVDLAIGAPFARCPDGTQQSGAVIVMYGSAGGIVNTRSRIFRPGVSNMQGSCISGTQFGVDLQAAGFDSGLTTDLAVGTTANAVHVIYAGDTGGLASAGNQRILSTDVGVAEGSRFGTKLAAGRLRRGSPGLIFGRSSLVVAATDETINGFARAGSVTILHAAASGLTTNGFERWTRSAARAVGAPNTDDRYGSSLSVGDFNDDGMADLAIGVPYYDDGAEADDGAVEVLYGSEFIFRDGLQL